MADIEKPDAEAITTETIPTRDSSNLSVTDFGFTPEEERRIIRRIDRRLVLTVGVLYCVSLTDRTNLSAAAIAGMRKELVMLGFGYSIVTLVFFITYTLFQPPSTIIIRALGPRVHLSTITVLWGAVMIGMGFVKSWQQLAGLRVILGICEAGFFPSAVYLLSTWYIRYEMGERYSIFYLLGCVASAFSGILAYGLMQMNGQAHLTGWRWIFIIEGVITCVLGIAAYWLLIGFPDQKGSTRGFLTEKELAWIIARVQADRGDAKAPPFNMRLFLRGGADIKVWAFGILFFCTTTLTYSLAYFLPIILSESMKFNVAKSTCLIAPPYAFAGIVMYLSGRLGDRFRIRGPFIVFNMILCLIGLPIMGWHSKAAVRYFGVFFVTAGANANIPAVMTYQGNNIRGQWKRAFASAILVGFGGIGGIAGSLVFRSQDTPLYRPGLYACIACALLTIIVVSLLTLKFKADNAKADRGEITLEATDDGNSDDFRYTY